MRACIQAPHTGPHTGSVQFIFWAELRYLSLPAFVPSTAIPRSAFDVNGTSRPLPPAPFQRIDASVDFSSSRRYHLCSLSSSIPALPRSRAHLLKRTRRKLRLRSFWQKYTYSSIRLISSIISSHWSSIVKVFQNLRKIWICRHFCIKLLAILKKEQFDSWEFK